MATAIQQPSFFDSDAFGDFMEVAKQRFPFSFKHSRVRGEGRFALAFHCGQPWKIYLYRTAAERHKAWDSYQWNSCGASRCTHDHRCEDL
jgi:hypothetical protein